jgi:arylsulfatase A-like enzyme
MLADDLGYGDLSLEPFTGGGIHTPNLERMANSSVVMTNFHVAAPVCTPSRAAILTGLFPHRLGIGWIFGSGTQANDHLSVLPNAPTIFGAEGYHTAHVGKWHLGGMTPADMVARSRMNTSTLQATCAPPGINQHGFKEYAIFLPLLLCGP